MRLKESPRSVDNSAVMTSTTVVFTEDWANHPIGKTLRGLIAAGGLLTGTFVVLLATLGTNAVWFLVLLGLTLGASAVRAALQPTMVRLAIVFVAMVAIPVAGLII